MQKWKQWYRSQNNKIRKNESGITLVELLAVLVLMSIVIALGGAIHMFGQRQFQTQTESANQNNDLSYAMTTMSSDLRKISLADIDEKITLNNDSNIIEIKDGATYFYDGNHLYRNNEMIVENLKMKPDVKFDGEGSNKDRVIIDRVIIRFNQENSEAGINNKDYHTTIYFRGEPTDVPN